MKPTADRRRVWPSILIGLGIAAYGVVILFSDHVTLRGQVVENSGRIWAEGLLVIAAGLFIGTGPYWFRGKQ